MAVLLLYPSPVFGEGGRDKSAFTRVCGALWRGQVGFLIGTTPPAAFGGTLPQMGEG